MGKSHSLLAMVAATVLGAAALSGCTSAEPAPTQPPATTASAFDDSAIIFAVQKGQVEKDQAISGTVLKQYSGTGPATISIPPLAEGQKQLGATAICSGSGDWKIAIDKVGPGWGSSGCSMDGGNSMSFPLPDPAKGSTVMVDVGADVKVWVTVFSTE
ncbi:MAG: hypothetical protein WBX27_20945 [Specibacter sp.]